MMSRIVLTALAIGPLLAPAVAGGAISVNIEDKDILPDPGGGQFTIDVSLSALDQEKEFLYLFELVPVLERIGGGPSDVRFVAPYAGRPDHFVFEGQPTTVEMEPPPPTDSDFRVLVTDVSDNGPYPDVIGDQMKAARFYLEYEPGVAAPAEYRIRLDPRYTAFGKRDISDASPPIIFADITDVGVIRLLPEPTCAPLLGTAIAFAARRRRTTRQQKAVS